MKKNTVNQKKIDEEVRNLSFGYTFLLISTIIFYVSLNNFTFYCLDIKFSFNIFILPIIFFLTNVITKEVGYKLSMKSLIISTIFMFIMSYFIGIAFNEGESIVRYIGISFAYFIANFINLIIYNFMLDNFKTPLVYVSLTMIFACLIYNMFYMLFALRMTFSDTFWNSYTIVMCVEALICIICAILLNFIKQGVEN